VKDIEDNNSFIDINDVADDLKAEYNNEFLKGTIIIDVVIKTKRERTRFQLYE
jgi:hypothetical protein